jgi:hypothetical protein
MARTGAALRGERGSRRSLRAEQALACVAPAPLAAPQPQQLAGARAGHGSRMMELLVAFLAATGLYWWLG